MSDLKILTTEIQKLVNKVSNTHSLFEQSIKNIEADNINHKLIITLIDGNKQEIDVSNLVNDINVSGVSLNGQTLILKRTFGTNLTLDLGQFITKDELANSINSAKVVYAGADSVHGRMGATWGTMGLNSYFIAPDSNYVVVENLNTLKIRKAGYYQISGNITMHSNHGHNISRTRILVNGIEVTYTHTTGHYTTWQSVAQFHSQKFNVGNSIVFSCHQTGKNPYNWHLHGRHTRIYLTYLGG